MENKKNELKKNPFEVIVVDKNTSEDYYNADMYIKMAHITTARSYWAFSIMIAVVVMTGIVLFNHYWSYDKLVLNKANIYLRNSTGLEYLTATGKSDPDTLLFKTINNGLNPISEEVRKNIIRNYIDANYITIPILGVKISIDDVMILMGITFLILAYWLYYCIRSENLTVGKILSLNQNKSINIRRYIFYGICFNNMFFPTTQRYKPYKFLSKRNKSLKDELDDIPEKKEKQKWRTDFLSIIFFLPILIMILCLSVHLSDILHITTGDEKIAEKITIKYQGIEYSIKDTKISSFDSDGHIDYDNSDLNLWIIFSVSVLITLWTSSVCYRLFLYQKGTSHVLYDFKKRFKHEDDCLKNIEYHQLGNKKKVIEVVALAQKIVFSTKKQFQDYKNRFIADYSTDNNYYFLTHTSGKDDEINKIKGFLTDQSNKQLPEFFEYPTKLIERIYSLDITPNSSYFRKIINKLFPYKNIENSMRMEYFIFLKTL